MGTNARNSDPPTSKEAEAGGSRRERNKAWARRQIDIHIALTHPEVINILSPCIDGEPRKRFGDLQREDYIVHSGYEKRNPPTNRWVTIWAKNPKLLMPAEQQRWRQMQEEGLTSGWRRQPWRSKRRQRQEDDFAWAFAWADKFKPLDWRVMVKPAGFFDM